MDTPSTSAAALKLEIARLTGEINRRKTEETRPQARAHRYPTGPPRSNVYVNPNYKPPSKPISPPPTTTSLKPAFKTQPPTQRLPVSTDTRDVVIGGVAFQSSGRSLVRKDLPKPVSSTIPRPPHVKPRPADFSRSKAGTLVNTSRVYKSKSNRGRPVNRNMTLNNTRRPFTSRRVSSKRLKYVDKPCPRFTTTGACNRGLTCMYQHDPSKIAICWNFLQGNCPNTAETCNLSHDPTPERTPLCVHFANNGRCTRQNCPFPHVRVGQRQGVCRDFAVLGYCEKGLDCDKQHVRECPDFAEKGACTTKGCKLPHVIRANRNRRAPAASNTTTVVSGPSSSGTDSPPTISDPSVASSKLESVDASGTDNVSSLHQVTAEDAQLGDEFISLTFHESESEEDSDGEEDEEGEEEEEEQYEGDDFHEDDIHIAED